MCTLFALTCAAEIFTINLFPSYCRTFHTVVQHILVEKSNKENDKTNKIASSVKISFPNIHTYVYMYVCISGISQEYIYVCLCVCIYICISGKEIFTLDVYWMFYTGYIIYISSYIYIYTHIYNWRYVYLYIYIMLFFLGIPLLFTVFLALNSHIVSYLAIFAAS